MDASLVVKFTLCDRQHIGLSRDLEIVMVNALRPWGNNQLLPLGPLREPLHALVRADIVVVHHADLVCGIMNQFYSHLFQHFFQ